MTPTDYIFNVSTSPAFPPLARGGGRHLPLASVLAQKGVDQGEGQSGTVQSEVCGLLVPNGAGV